MSALARPAVLASVLVGAALALHPALGASRWLPGRPAVLAALFVLAVLAFVARPVLARERRLGGALTAAGVALLVAALAGDGLRGHHGTLTLAEGQSLGSFEETAPDGRALGLRPLGFPVRVERILASGGPSGPRVALVLPRRRGPAELTGERSVAVGRYRFARPRVRTTGGVSRLRVAVSDGTATQVAEVSPGAPARAGDLTISLGEYFPDFALDARQKPFSRSAEPRNPAALLDVQRGGEAYRAFVLQSMPGLHRVEGLGLTFSLLDVEPERTVEIAVHREPVALAVLAGALLLAAGLALSLRLLAARAEGDRHDPALVAGSVLVVLLLVADRGAILAWSFGVSTTAGRAPLPGVGALLGAAFIAALGGSLLLGAGRLAGANAAPAAQAMLWLAVAAATAGLLLAAVRLAGLPVAGTAALPLAGPAFTAACLAASLFATGPGAPSLVVRVARFALPLGVLAALVLAMIVAVSGVLRDGTYATPSARSSAATVLLGLAALEQTRAPGPRRFAFLLSLSALAVV
jgi:hypothetical protein